MPKKIDFPVTIKKTGNTVFCSLSANARTDTSFTMKLFHSKNDPGTMLADDVEVNPKARIRVGEPADVANAIIVVVGDTVKASPNDDTYRVVMRCYQGTEKIGESDPIEGTFGDSKIVSFKITSPLK